MSNFIQHMSSTSEPIPAEWERFDPTFASVNGDDWLGRIFVEGRWLEGPTYFPAGRYLVFSDIPNNRLLRWDESNGVVSVFREPSNYSNGHTRDRAGRLVSCEQATRRVTRTEHDGTVTVLADRFDGKRFNSPNDIVEHSDGSLWFTDPNYGIISDYEGIRAAQEMDGCHVYRLNPISGEVIIVANDFSRPNGLAFSADERLLYIADTREKHIRVFDVDGARLSGGEAVMECSAGTFDGMRFDDTGRLWAAAHDGVHCFHPEGDLLGKLRVPQAVSNLCWGGPRLNHLFITATSTVYTMRLNVNGLRG